MKVANISEAEVHLSKLIEKAAMGEVFIIAKAEKPMVRVAPIDRSGAPPTKKCVGFMKGMFATPDDFDTMMAEEIEEMVYGTPDKFKDR